MKKYTYVIVPIFFLLLIVSCKDNKANSKLIDKFDLSGKMYSVVPKTTTVFWTGFKTMAKTPVKGQFMKVDIDNIKKSKTARGAIDGISFSIPVSSIFSNEESRDTKLRDFFFGAMEQTIFVKGKIRIENDTLAVVSVSMNAVTKDIPMKYFIDGQMLSMDASIDVLDWKAQDALTSLHKVCEEKHTGEDGISKTWSEVEIHVASYLKVE